LYAPVLSRNRVSQTELTAFQPPARPRLGSASSTNRWASRSTGLAHTGSGKRRRHPALPRALHASAATVDFRFSACASAPIDVLCVRSAPTDESDAGPDLPRGPDRLGVSRSNGNRRVRPPRAPCHPLAAEGPGFRWDGPGPRSATKYPSAARTTFIQGLGRGQPKFWPDRPPTSFLRADLRYDQGHPRSGGRRGPSPRGYERLFFFRRRPTSTRPRATTMTRLATEIHPGGRATDRQHPGRSASSSPPGPQHPCPWSSPRRASCGSTKACSRPPVFPRWAALTTKPVEQRQLRRTSAPRSAIALFPASSPHSARLPWERAHPPAYRARKLGDDPALGRWPHQLRVAAPPSF